MMKNCNAYHIIIKFLKNFFNHNHKIYKKITDSENFLAICLHNTGCSSIQKVYELAPIEYENRFNDLLISYSSKLLFSDNGGYVIISLINNKKKILYLAFLNLRLQTKTRLKKY